MTPLPAILPGARVATPGQPPPPPARGQGCSHPVCGRPAGHQHHAVGRSWQRSNLGHVTAWLLIENKLVLVLVDLCPEHHDKLESGWNGCESRLIWAGCGWMWYDRAHIEQVLENHIVYTDPKNNTQWILRGFCKGEYVQDERS